MSAVRVDIAPLIVGSVIVGDTGFGVIGADIPSTGTNGASVLYQHVTLPADNDVEFRMLITVYPAVGTLTTFEDGSFIYTAPVPTTDSFTYEWFRDGVSQGTDTVNLTIGVVGGIIPIIMNQLRNQGIS